MTSVQHPPDVAPAELRRLLHEVNHELSIAIGELELLAERSGIDPAMHAALQDSLYACGRAAEHLRAMWRVVDGRQAPPEGAA